MDTSNNNSQHIIAIGASAGGMEAIHNFFDHTPQDKVSYVIVQHLSPDFKSRMAELLAKHSKLKICDVEDNMIVEQNQVYMIPHEKFMTIEGGKLRLTSKKEQPGPHMTINIFFESLAADRGDKAIGIILSGTGTDGGTGVKAIKKMGGIVLVQDPATAKFGGMPSYAISTGFTDAILPTEAMPKAIENYLKKLPWKPEATEKEGSFKEQGSSEEEEETILKAILNLLKSHLPNDFSDYKYPTLKRRVTRRMTYSNFNSWSQYFAFLQNNPIEMETLASTFLIGVTRFFRDEGAYEVLKTDIIPKIVKNQNTENAIKVWVAGCSTGEEAYSLAMLLHEHLTKINKNKEVKIFATDIDRTALDFASKGLYPENIEKNVSKERLDRFFTHDERGYKVKQFVRKMLIIAEHDLVKNPPYCNVDLISCRNLLIYLNPILQKKVVSMFYFGLKKEGFLFLGSSENATLREPGFLEINKKCKIYSKTGTSTAARFNDFSLPIPEDRKRVQTPSNSTVNTAYKTNDVVEHVNEALMNVCGFAGVCIDEDMIIIQSFGDLRPYLRPKMFEFNLNELLDGPLAVAVKTAITKSRKESKEVVLSKIPIESHGINLFIKLHIKPVNRPRSDQKLSLILFSKEENGQGSGANHEVYQPDQQTKDYLSEIETELKVTKEDLRSALDKLEASNENMQSFNEELLSANEEMQSGNEELESVNEELQTVNSEHLLTIKELTDVNDDLNNYFRSNVNGQLYVDNDLLLKNFSPATVQHINLRKSDIGRPINNITTNIKFETIAEDIKKVVTDGVVITKEVQSTTEKWYQVMAMPYIRQVDNKQDGAIITFNDITDMKRLLEELDASNKSLMRINADLDNFVYSASHDLMAPISNIEGLTNLIKTKLKQNPEVKEIAEMIVLAITKFKAVIKDLGEIGKIESEMQKDRDKVNLEELVNDIRLTILDHVTTTNAKIHCDFKIKEISFSKKNLRSIFYNLISNSIKYKSQDREPEIVVSTEAVEGFIMLSFSDNGMGMLPDKLDSIFTLYSRLGQQVEGQGIGLYLVKKIIDAAGGKVEVESEFGQGTTFKIFFKP